VQLIERSQDMLRIAAAAGWKISPLATAVALSATDAEPYLPFRHLKLASDAIRRAVVDGGRLIISMPPQHGKSQTASKYTTIWFLENWPHRHVILGGYGKDFARDWGREVRNLVSRRQDILSFDLASDSTKADYWHTNKGGSMLCVGTGSGVTGKPGNLILIDDPIKGQQQAGSFTERENVWRWYLSELRTRVHRGTAIILIMTRWNEDDLAGRLLKKNVEGWKVLNLPAIYDEQAAMQGPCPLGRQIGEALCPELHDLDDLSKQQQNSLEVWESLYQGRPGTTAGLGNVYNSYDDRRNVRTCDRDPNLRVFLSVDFNVDPMCGVIGQYKELFSASPIHPYRYGIVEVLDEICLPNSCTEEWAREAVGRLKKICGNYDIDLEIYGDPAGRARHTSQVSGSDYDIIQQVFRQSKQFKIKMCVKSSAPAIKDRVNAVNAMFRNAVGEIRCYLDARCAMLRRDLLNVKWKRDMAGNTTGQLAKDQKDLTHVSDALGYFLETKFGRGGQVGEQAGLAQ
jgi:hypothetical protein